MTAHLRKHGILSKITEHVRFARKRFGRYEIIDFLAVLAGLRYQRGTDPGGVLRAAPALRGPVHGLV
jgi:hypothetical protein